MDRSETERAENYRDKWEITIEKDSVVFIRLCNKKPVEVYRSFSRREACVHAAAIIQGYQPVRFLENLDIPPDGTQLE